MVYYIRLDILGWFTILGHNGVVEVCKTSLDVLFHLFHFGLPHKISPRFHKYSEIS